jgi:hypothetical protein
MRILVVISVLFFTACKTRTAKRPLWTNAVDSLQLPNIQLQFIAEEKEWQARLLTATQPIALRVTQQRDQLVLDMFQPRGVIEGDASICLSTQGQYFYYPVYLINEYDTLQLNREFRSPKTVNPDSGLYLHRMKHATDVYRNILPTQPRQKYFYEERVSLPPKAGLYRAVAAEPLTTYYVLPGSCATIPLMYSYNKQENCFYVTAGVLKDKDNNIVADGTMVAFIYGDEEETYRIEVSLLCGKAIAIIPAEEGRRLTIRARINETISSPVILKH